MKQLTLPDLDLAYRDEGDGPPLVLLHGWPERSAIWERLIPLLTPRYRVIAPPRGDGCAHACRTAADHGARLLVLGTADPVLRVAWQETLGDVFTRIACEQARGAGHFVPWERPDDSAARITAFFDGLV